MKVLFVATVRSHIGQFHMPFIKKLKELGCTVDAAFKDNSNEKPGLDLSAINTVYEVSFSRSPYSTDNLKAYRRLKRIIDDGNYDVVHCHTPMGGVVTRLAAKAARKNGTKVIYTAHGFHFYNGASRKNWLLYYPIEKYLSKYTDCLITINNEDFALASSKLNKAGKICYVQGVGVDLDMFKEITPDKKAELRLKNGYSNNDFLLIYPADFSYRKNQKMIFDAVALVLKKHKHIRLLLPGALDGAEECRNYCEQIGIAEYVDFLGYRRDIYELDGMCDLSLSSSRQEGLPINLIEAMALGNPIVATDVRGNNDLVIDGETGYLVPLNDSELMADSICRLIDNQDLCERFGNTALETVKKYSVDQVNKEIIEIYKQLHIV